jgi:hypothetical protein
LGKPNVGARGFEPGVALYLNPLSRTSHFPKAPALVNWTLVSRALLYPRKGLSPPDSCVPTDCQRTFFRFATRTPSHAANSRGNWACRWGRIELVSFYLERGADALEADAERWATLWHGLRSAGITRLSSCSARMAQGDLSDQSPLPGRPVKVQIPSPVAPATSGGI